MTNLATNFAGLKLKNPVTVGSGTYGFGSEYKRFYNPNILGAITSKGMTLNEKEGNPPGRSIETPSGMLNCVGLQNPGVEFFAKEHLPKLKEDGCTVFANVAGKDVDEYVEIVRFLDSTEVDAVEVNLSCPNVAEGGIAFGTDPKVVEEVTRKTVAVTSKPIIIKLTPNVADIVSIAQAAQNGGAHGISLINTLLGMSIDTKKRRPVLSNTFGGLSGPAIKPVALRMVYQVYPHIDIPIIGMGGIVNSQDALEFIMAGAQMVAVGTGNFVNPLACQEIIEGLEMYLEENDIEDINQLVGIAHK
ncbi:dihydroorotate dehydrogenase [Proteinivorax tanatarense]|uniref:Dihydroorotate dehydrogenase n=1 Tax=Proteinivorax tanatarense TaxID=1260629 RepID=A0AAU7VPG5_9FIRM